ncbi:type I DNA topoisomerase [bacterium (Candidatus Gribaldobacteria) CG08_land_8_20_14_0_20_39_15]|uniref:DNA topoisomerase 1 n=1 Tax=bacterium (Candidatus Gribaldobacteria) CG08_land_8_20_14_0_20_39_15 TaxID=2014273 RepID=A0A2M6XUS5_9BACT|nr:MAG: type I DNA topoisomerase [bacterium (Candidatus Gribaldobacteria) CG08_land_8_20_14_0_20_39_15]
MQLVIVESPTKAKTISKFLSSNYKIESSFGHIRDLPEKELGVDIKKNFEPKYVIPAKAKSKVTILKTTAKKAKNIILATDSDREGEAIAWHLAYILDLKKPQRIVFHEITKSAIEKALENPRDINSKLVNAQQARRILDRLVGYKLSPFLWKKVMRGLSAGRVQSVAVRLICDRENEIANFKPEEFWSIEAILQKQNGYNVILRSPQATEGSLNKDSSPAARNDKVIKAILVAKDGKTISKLEIKNKAEADKILLELEGAEYKVIDVKRKEIQRNPLPPFTTSTLQQMAANKLGFTAKRTMMASQRLYENGLITYHRTDSLNLSTIAQKEAQNFICEQLGKNYWPGFSRSFQTKSKGAQEAHEAIRPTYPGQNTPERIKTKSTPEMFKIYDLVWRRFMASQMTPAIFDATAIDVEAKNYTFRATGQRMKFDGFLKVYPMKFAEADLPKLAKNEILQLKDLLKEQHFTQPPSRYSEATLIKTLEKEGIGRPSTYAPILNTIQTKNYVEKDENKKFMPTKIGAVVNTLLVEHFPEIVDIGFTAQMEQEFDEIAQGKDSWQKTLSDFYFPFEKTLKEKEKSVVKIDFTEKTDRICPECGGIIIIRLGRFGKFYACSKFPNCKFTENIKKPALNVPCPKCGSELVEKNTKKRKIFYGCSKWPDCDFALWDKPTGEKCPKCGSLMVQSKTKKIFCSNKECVKPNKKKNPLPDI